jgi:hypothetical protein
MPKKYVEKKNHVLVVSQRRNPEVEPWSTKVAAWP